MNTKAFVFGLVAATAGWLVAAPTVSVTRMTQKNGVVQIDYALSGEAAIVTVDFQTDGVSISETER